MWLQVAWLEATGEPPPLSANSTRPGPFARLAQTALELLGTPEADAVELIRGLARCRSEKRLSGHNTRTSADSLPAMLALTK